jgi:hypothetical protein
MVQITGNVVVVIEGEQGYFLVGSDGGALKL